MSFNLNGGVLIIGSLFWQDDIDPAKKDQKRKEWREEYLDIGKSASISAPIRYGRFSKDQSYTMVFDNKLHNNQYGKAKAVPFKKNFTTVSEIVDVVESLSQIEGKYDSYFVKGKKDPTVAWCVCSVLFNPDRITDEDKNAILKKWDEELKENETGYLAFSEQPDIYSATIDGELNIDWPKELKDLDFLVATSTMPRNREGVEEVNAEEIAEHVRNREYFWPNRKHGIVTYQDEDIIRFLNESEMVSV